MADLEKLARSAAAQLMAGDRPGGLKAVRELSEALDGMPENVRAAWRIRMGELYLKARRFGQAEKYLAEALPEAGSDSLRVTLQLRRALQGQGRLKEAAEVGSRYLTMARVAGDEAVAEALGDVMEDPELGPYTVEARQALEDLERLLHEDVADRIGKLELLRDRVDKQGLLWEDPVHGLALASQLLKDSSLMPASELHSWFSLARERLMPRAELPLVGYMAGQLAWVEGSILAQHGELEAACEALEAADRLLPEDEGIRADKSSSLMLALQLADCLLESRRHSDAEHLYRHALKEVDGENRPLVIFQAHHGLGRICYLAERLAEAYRHMRRALTYFDYAEPPWIGRATPELQGVEDYQLLREQREEIEAVIRDCRERLPEEIAKAFDGEGRAFRPEE